MTQPMASRTYFYKAWQLHKGTWKNSGHAAVTAFASPRDRQPGCVLREPDLVQPLRQPVDTCCHSYLTDEKSGVHKARVLLSEIIPSKEAAPAPDVGRA